MSVRVTFECACRVLDLDKHLDVSAILADVLCGMTYVFVESDTFDLPEDPIALICHRTGEVDCVLTESTWTFPTSMPQSEVLAMTSVLISNEISARLGD